MWLAQQGWFVTAVDFSETAIKRARRLAVERGVNVDFMVADATTYQPPRKYDLVVSFYIQLFPEQRAKMLANAVDALVPGGTLLFVSHDRSGPPPDWEEEFITTLTTPEEVVAELPGLEIQKAFVFGHGPGRAAWSTSQRRYRTRSWTRTDSGGQPRAAQLANYCGASNQPFIIDRRNIVYFPKKALF